MFRKLTAITAVAIVAVTLTGCTPSTNEDGSSKSITAYTVTISNGDTVNCLINDAPIKGGVQCDWDNVGASGYESISSLVGTVETVGETSYMCVTSTIPKKSGMDCNF